MSCANILEMECQAKSFPSSACKSFCGQKWTKNGNRIKDPFSIPVKMLCNRKREATSWNDIQNIQAIALNIMIKSKWIWNDDNTEIWILNIFHFTIPPLMRMNRLRWCVIFMEIHLVVNIHVLFKYLQWLESKRVETFLIVNFFLPIKSYRFDRCFTYTGSDSVLSMHETYMNCYGWNWNVPLLCCAVDNGTTVQMWKQWTKKKGTQTANVNGNIMDIEHDPICVCIENVHEIENVDNSNDRKTKKKNKKIIE